MSSIENFKYTKYKVYFMSTTIKVEENVIRDLKTLKKKLGVRSINKVIEHLIKEYKSKNLEQAFGVDRGKITGFTEEDRLEDRP